MSIASRLEAIIVRCTAGTFAGVADTCAGANAGKTVSGHDSF